MYPQWISDLGVPIYDTPTPHILWEDLKLALGTLDFQKVRRYIEGVGNEAHVDGVSVQTLVQLMPKGNSHEVNIAPEPEVKNTYIA